MRNAVVRARVEEDLKNKASEVFKTVGLSMSEAIHLFLKQTVLTQALPFPVSVPDATTKRAMPEVQDRQNLIYPETGNSIFDDLHSNRLGVSPVAQLSQDSGRCPSSNEVDTFIKKLRDQKPLLRDKYGVRALGIFGSYVRGEQKKKE